MSRVKKVNSHYDVAITRCAALKSIDPQLDLGYGLTIQQYEADIQLLRDKINAYNTALSQLDQLKSEVTQLEKLLQERSARMLTGVVTRFGLYSDEYQKAGGTKITDRRKVKRNLPGASS